MYSAVIIDDEFMIKQSLKKMIEESCCFHVSGEADNGQEALRLFDELSPELAITDIRMPVMDGLHLIKEAKKHHSKMEFIIISGYDEFYYARQAISLGVAEYLLKPVKPGQFIDTVRRVHSKIDLERKTVDIRLNQIRKCKRMALEIAESIWKVNEEGTIGTANQFIVDLLELDCDCIAVNEMFSMFLSFINDEIVKIKNELLYENVEKNIIFTDDSVKSGEVLKKYLQKLLNEMRRKNNWCMSKAAQFAADHIKNHYSEADLSLNKLAEVTTISPITLSKAFKEETGMNYIDYLSEIRIKKAKALLNDFHLKVYEVGERVGFNEYAHFTRVFKKHAGVTPTEFRQRLI